MKIVVIGTGYVGLVTGACLGDFGNQVVCIDRDRSRLSVLKKGKIPFYEPGLLELVQRNVDAGRLSFSQRVPTQKPLPEIFFITVGTPPTGSGEADISAVLDASEQIGQAWLACKTPFFLVVTKSTVPVGTADKIKARMLKMRIPQEVFSVASNPEFLREGSAVMDFMHPDRIVIGGDPGRALHLLSELYRPQNAHIFFTSTRAAELVKYAANAFLATKISFINEISRVCEYLGLDVVEVIQALGLDRRIGRQFLNAGLGYGGSCLPKDVNALIRLSEDVGYSPKLLSAVNDVNEMQPVAFAEKIGRQLKGIRNKKIAVLGLSFKPGTDDIRESPSLKLIGRLLQSGASVVAYDPVSEKSAKVVYPQVAFCDGPYETLRGVDAVVVATEWPEFRELDLRRVRKLVRHPNLFDGRNIYDPNKVKESGFLYFGVGR